MKNLALDKIIRILLTQAQPSSTLLKKQIMFHWLFLTRLGQKVRTLLNTKQVAGSHSIMWDARDDFGTPLSGGIYFYQLQVGEQMSIKKMILIK